MSLTTVLEEYTEESAMDDKAFNEYLNENVQAAKGDTDLPDDTTIDIGAGPERVGNELPDIDIGAPKKTGPPGPKLKLTQTLPPGVADAFARLGRAVEDVDRTVQQVGNDIYMTEGWWSKVRQEVEQKAFVDARTHIQEFQATLDTNVTAEAELYESLQKLRVCLT